jgi:adenylate cyclase
VRKTLSLIRLRIARLWWVMILISAVGTGLGFAWWHFDFLSMSDDERNAYDDGLKRFNNKWWFPWGKRSMHEDVILVGVDDRTFDDIASFPQWSDRYGSWPFDRIIWHDLVEYLDGAGAKLIVMDFTMTENKPDPTGDDRFGEALQEARVPVVMGFNSIQLVTPLPAVEHPSNHLHEARPKPEEAADAGGDEAPAFPEELSPAEELKRKREAAEKLRARAAEAYAFPVKLEGGIEAQTFEPVPAMGHADGGVASTADLRADAGLMSIELPRYPVPAIAQLVDSAAGFGTVEVEADEDGKMRETHFVYTDGVNNYLTLGAAAAAELWKAESFVMRPGKLTLGTHAVRVNLDGSAKINFGGKMADRFHTVSLSDVLRYATAAKDSPLAKEGAQRFKDKVVFVGAIAQGTGDQKATPFASLEAGVVKQMATFENIVNDDFILEAPPYGALLLAFMVALFSVSIVMIAQSFITDVGAPVFLTFAFFILTGGFITFTNMHILSAMPGMAGTLAALLATTYNRFLADKDREFFRDVINAYIEPDLVDQLVESRRRPSLDGEWKEVTAFFSDIRGFTSLTESLKDEPKKLMDLLRQYLSTVVPVLKDEGACIDKYIGDAVVALFGAPAPHDDHALRACRAALKVQQALAGLRKELEAQGLPHEVHTRIGLNSDRMWVGNVGSVTKPIEYTAIGDGMNLASRLEGANKAFDTLILIGPKTHEAVKGALVTRELDAVRVAGKQEVIVIYELCGTAEQVPPQKRQVLELYGKALELYRHRRFHDALRTLKEAYDIDRTDGPVKVLAGKCNQLVQHPPPADWDGVTQLEK